MIDRRPALLAVPPDRTGMRQGMSHSAQPVIRPGFGDSPVGSVIAFAGNPGAPMPATASPPDTTSTGNNVTQAIEAWGWMLCDGRTLVTQWYPELFAVLGYQYGGSGSNFKIPDYRGYFLRGMDNGAGKDPDLTLRTAADGGSEKSSTVGSIQTSAMLIHRHDYQIANTGVAAGQGTSATISTKQTQTTDPTNKDGVLLQPDTGISNFETRPMNIYVNYLIKFTYGLR